MEQAAIKLIATVIKSAEHNIYLIISLSSIVSGLAGAWFINQSSYRVRLLDHPSERSSHDVIIPKGGGIGIFVAFVLVSMVLNIPTTFVFSAMLVSLVSFYDDSRDLSAKFRLGIHFIAAILLILPFLYDAARLSVVTQHISSAPFLWAILYILFIVATANFYNFMDGINGIAGISGIIGFGLIALYYGQFLHIDMVPVSRFAILAVCVSLACLGFLPFNMPQAKVFMGDIGSVLLGFVFAGMILKLSHNLLDIICMASFLFPFYADELTTMWIRFRNHERLSQSHRKHLYQLLVNEFRIPHWKIALLYGFVQLIIGLSIIFIRDYGLLSVLVLLLIYFTAFSLLGFHLRRKPSIL